MQRYSFFFNRPNFCDDKKTTLYDLNPSSVGSPTHIFLDMTQKNAWEKDIYTIPKPNIKNPAIENE